jgi:hypothetical protein
MKKVRISVGLNQLNGYVNIDPLHGKNPENFDEDVLPSECNEIILENILEYIPQEQLPSMMEYWVSKMRHKGKISVKFTNLAAICRKYLYNRLTAAQINELLYGSGQHVWDVRRGNYEAQYIEEILLHMGLVITGKEISGTDVLLTAERP